MPPTCSNCGATDFVWANELKTGGGLSGAGTLSLRPRGETPLGTRICRSCGHADLFLRDLTLLHKPHTWKPGEFVPIQGAKSPAKSESSHHHSGASHPAPAAAEPAATATPATSALPPPLTPPTPPPPVPPSPPTPARAAEPPVPAAAPEPERPSAVEMAALSPTPPASAEGSPAAAEPAPPVSKAKVAPKKRAAKKAA